MPAPHTLTPFEDAMLALRDDALMMASLANRLLDNARRGIFEREEAFCNTAIADDEEIDTLEIQIDRGGMGLMLRFHPVASDLRDIVSTMKLAVNLERVADQGVNIARRGRRLLAQAPLPETALLAPAFDCARTMLKDAIRAFADRDGDLARSLKLRDKELDRINREYAEQLTARMAGDTKWIPSYLDLIFISRFLERVGDQAKSIGEDTLYAISSEDTRHTKP